MDFLSDTSLSHYVTMQIGGPAKAIVKVTTELELLEAYTYAKEKNVKIQVIGEGSNIVFSDNGFDGLIIVNAIQGLLIDQEIGEVRIGAGTNWHEVVVQTVDAGLTGIEAMALIPGTSGATPINNVGAYGQDISQVLTAVHALDTTTGVFVELSNSDCHFSYRNSMFKSISYGRYIISSITLRLHKAGNDYTAPNYPALQSELAKREINYPTPKDVMETVIAIRSAKLPDPKVIANTGSFFKNPIVPANTANQLLVAFPDMPHFPQNNGTVKLAAGWLIEQTGLKGFAENGIRVYQKQALVLVNEQATSFADLRHMINKVTTAVQDKFGVTLEPEPEIIT